MKIKGKVGAWNRALFLMLLSTIVPGISSAQDFEYERDGYPITITRYKGTGGVVTLPSLIEGAPVRIIGPEAFKNNTEVTEIVFPDSLIGIEWRAFEGCTNLKSITMPMVYFKGNYVFSGCTSLTSITFQNPMIEIPKGTFYNCVNLSSVPLPDQLSVISEAAFSGCASLSELIIPQSVTVISKDAFRGCDSLVDVVIPDSVTQLGHNSFRDCTSLESLVVGEGVTYISVGAFAGCSSLSSVSMSEKVTGIGGGAFKDCASLSLINIPDHVTEIRSGAFAGCSSLLGFSVPSEIKKIEENVFNGCKSLSSIVIPEGVDTIGERAFRYCSSLESIEIPDSVSSIGADAFDGCGSLKRVGLGNGLGIIGNGAFNECVQLQEVVIPKSVWAIYGNAFRCCTGLTSITVEEPNLYYRSIDGVLYNFDETELIQYPAGKSGNFSVPASVNTIAGNAFSGSAGLVAVDIPASVTSIGVSAFSGCSGLSELYVSEENPVFSSLEGVLFSRDKSLLIWFPQGKQGGYVVPEEVAGISSGVFRGCKGLTGITFGSGMGFLWGTFLDCPKLRWIQVNQDNPYYSSVDGVLMDKAQTHLIFFPEGRGGNYEIPYGITSIGLPPNYGLGRGGPCSYSPAFYDCGNLESVVIPESVAEIGYGDFSSCSNLQVLYFGGDSPTVNHSPDYQYSWSYPPTLENSGNAIICYPEGALGWEETFCGHPTATWSWSGSYRVIGDSADTYCFLGWLNVEHSPWVWCYNSECWLYVSDQVADAGRGWIKTSSVEGLQLDTVDGTTWSWSNSLKNWIYTPESSMASVEDWLYFPGY